MAGANVSGNHASDNTPDIHSQVPLSAIKASGESHSDGFHDAPCADEASDLTSSPIMVAADSGTLKRELGAFYETQDELNLAFKRSHDLRKWDAGPNSPALWMQAQAFRRRFLGIEEMEERERERAGTLTVTGPGGERGKRGIAS
ncbi:hypothetical protein CAC42_3648 [Sphaceloma murrayae]|uniref:Uncharacterized protein n=1 Tax=Sphaceloma murrayae TaxID=2082308 RepID=A0A2K1QPP7_9PEZI|nr:hypothetical protein CAC42_3648 [Sphaceloma murrayae]